MAPLYSVHAGEQITIALLMGEEEEEAERASAEQDAAIAEAAGRLEHLLSKRKGRA